MFDVSRIYPLQQSLVTGSCVKMLVRRVLSDRYRRTEESIQYQGVEIFRAFSATKVLLSTRAMLKT